MNHSSLAITHLGRLFLLAVPLALNPLPAQRMELADRKAKPVVVESATVTTEVTGHLAVTTFDLVFHNPNARVLEGTLVFPLLDGQRVTRFALDINGALREAVPVDKTRGRAVFEEIERRGIDPGLIEQVAGNNYRARIYPIPANGSRRVVIAYQEDLAGATGPALYRLTLAFPGKLKNFRLALTVLTGGDQPAQARTNLDLQLPAWREGKYLEIERADFAARGQVELTLPPLEHPGVITGRAGDNEYFYAEVPISATARPRPAPRVAGLIWDSSGSGGQRDHDREFALLDAWFKTVRNLEVRLVRLRDQAEAPRTFVVKNGDWSALKKELIATVYDGATALDGLADDPAVQEWLLFSDGLINYGITQPGARLPFKGVVHGILSSPSADPAWMKSVALRHGGEFVDLLATAPAAAAARLRSASVRVLEVRYDPAAVAEVFPEAGSPVVDGRMVVTGRLRQPEATVSLVLGPDATSDPETVTLQLRSGENPSRLAGPAWAAAKIAHLSLDPAANREDIRRTSREFGLVTADTSLIVLETVADYVRYEIPPPPELQAEWDAAHQTSVAALQEKGSEHLTTVVREFQEKVAWWEKSFPKDTPPPPTDAKRAAGFSAGLPQGIEERRRQPDPSTTVLGPSAGGANSESPQTLSAFEVRSDADRDYSDSNIRTGTLSAPASVSVVSREFLNGMSTRSATYGSSHVSNQESGDGLQPGATITLKPWSPKAGYLDHLRRAAAGQRYRTYLEERPDHLREPGFFLDVANYFFEQGDPPNAFRILSNLAELELEDVALLRVLGHRLVQADQPTLALPLFERVLVLRPDEAQSYRDLALVCAGLGQAQRAVDLLTTIVTKDWDQRFPEIELIALTELNAIAATCGQTLDLSRVDPRLRQNLPVATRVILTWDAADCDIDLWVTDPNGEVTKYDRPLSYQGGRMSRDFTNGYGPEEFMLRDPKPGVYRIQINYYGDRRQSGLGPVTAQVRLISDFGTAKQSEKRLTVRLEENKETLDVGTFEVPSPGK